MLNLYFTVYSIFKGNHFKLSQYICCELEIVDYKHDNRNEIQNASG